MAWIRVFTDFDDNPKTIALKKLLKNPYADALPQRLWRWALKHAPGGDLTSLSDDVVAAGCGWPDDPEVLMSAFLKTGFIDPNRHIHDWADGTGQYETKTINGRVRMQRFRDKQKRASDANETRTSASRDAYVTKPDPDPDTDPEVDQNLFINEVTSKPEPEQSSPQNGDGPALPKGFELFWKTYPRKVGKGAALRAWKNTSKVRPSIEELTGAVIRAKNSEQWTKSDGQFIPHPATWLNQHRWTDEHDAMDTVKYLGGVPQRPLEEQREEPHSGILCRCGERLMDRPEVLSHTSRGHFSKPPDEWEGASV